MPACAGFRGFVSLDAPYGADVALVTKPLNISGATTLELNVDAGPGGYVRAELLSADNTPIPGYASSRRINRNAVHAAVDWEGGRLLPRSISVVRLRLYMQHRKRNW